MKKNKSVESIVLSGKYAITFVQEIRPSMHSIIKERKAKQKKEIS
ncbi:hypothetical protein [Bacillus sp. WMMC1349]|nr:hypothetical protein [Bacillus sp. WMMC1349]